MNKTELIERIAEEADVPAGEAQRHFGAFERVVTEALKGGDEVRITGFGKFSVRMATSLHDVLRGMLEDARRYQVLAKKANGSLSGRPAAGPDEEAVSGALKEIAHLGRSQAREAERLLTQRTAG